MKPKRTSDVETKMLPDGHVVIFSKNSDWAHTITPLAAIAWEFCDGEHSLEQIVEKVVEYADGEKQNLQPAITELLNDFAQSGLVTDAAA
ncbi:MAG TPA: PqqD family protein [Drouetiella sp.]